MQEGAKKLSVAERAARDAARLGLEDNINGVVAAAVVEFRQEPALAAQSAALVPGRGAPPAPAAGTTAPA